MPGTAIIWFRRDLRVRDHPALAAAVAEHDHVVPVFILDDRLLHGRFASGPRTAFMLGCLRALDDQLTARGGRLVVRHGRPAHELVALAQEVGAQTVLWTSDVSAFALERDAAVTLALVDAGVEARPQPGNFCADVSQTRTKADRPMTVFTPFWRQWEKLERRRLLKAPSRITLPAGLDLGSLPDGPQLSDELAEPFCQIGRAHV